MSKAKAETSLDMLDIQEKWLDTQRLGQQWRGQYWVLISQILALLHKEDGVLDNLSVSLQDSSSIMHSERIRSKEGHWRATPSPVSWLNCWADIQIQSPRVTCPSSFENTSASQQCNRWEPQSHRESCFSPCERLVIITRLNKSLKYAPIYSLGFKILMSNLGI